MSISGVPAGNTPVDPQVRVFARPVSQVVEHQLNATQTNGQPNLIQATDQLDISAGARHALEATMAHQDLKFAEGTGGDWTPAERKFVFNGDVYQAVQNYQNGQGTMKQIVSALAARGERIDEVLSGTAQPLTDGEAAPSSADAPATPS
jgi:hypothetical protein